VSGVIPQPNLTLAYRLEAEISELLDLGETHAGRRRIAHLRSGRFSGPGLEGELVPGASADWQLILPDGTAIADIRYTLRTDDGALLYVRSQGIRHGPPAVLARIVAGEDVAAGEYTYRLATTIETAAPELDWMNKGIFVAVGARGPAGVVYETYLAG
jgi:Protein of unknown function (DUF3237)